jgi:hypothetical protein
MISLGGLACGRKGDPIPRPRAEPKICVAQWATLRRVDVRLPLQDIRDHDLVGVEKVRVYYLPLGTVRPSPQEMLSRGELIFERRRPDLPSPGVSLSLDLKEISRPAGWIVVTAVRVGDILGVPSDVLPWLDPAL